MHNPSYMKVGEYAVAGEARRALFLHPAGSIEYPLVRLSSRAELCFWIGINSDVWDKAGDGVEFSVFGLPEWHPYFEHLFTGFMKGAMEHVCANPVEATRLRGDSEGFTYLLHTGLTELDGKALAPHGGTRGRKDILSGHGLTHREVEVLQLIAQGKTNKEIGCLLGISDRTVQIHASHVYDKIGAYNRAGATLWAAEHRGRLD